MEGQNIYRRQQREVEGGRRQAAGGRRAGGEWRGCT